MQNITLMCLISVALVSSTWWSQQLSENSEEAKRTEGKRSCDNNDFIRDCYSYWPQYGFARLGSVVI